MNGPSTFGDDQPAEPRLEPPSEGLPGAEAGRAPACPAAELAGAAARAAAGWLPVSSCVY